MMLSQSEYLPESAGFSGDGCEDISSIMLGETEHRFGNLLSSLAAELRWELVGSSDPDVRDLLDRLEKRIVGLAQLQRVLASNAFHDREEPQAYLARLLEMLTRSILTPINVHCQAAIGSGPLSAGQCRYLARILVELVINASKHAFPDGNGGLIDIALGLRDGMWLCLVSDDGCGFGAHRSGVGSRILSALIDALGGKLSVQSASTGTAVLVEFPVDYDARWLPTASARCKMARRV